MAFGEVFGFVSAMFPAVDHSRVSFLLLASLCASKAVKDWRCWVGGAAAAAGPR